MDKRTYKRLLKSLSSAIDNLVIVEQILNSMPKDVCLVPLVVKKKKKKKSIK